MLYPSLLPFLSLKPKPCADRRLLEEPDPEAESRVVVARGQGRGQEVFDCFQIKCGKMIEFWGWVVVTVV